MLSLSSPRVILLAVLNLAAASACFGQATPAELYAIMTSDTISDSQSEQITQWVEGCVQSVRTGRQEALQRARSDILALTAPTATPAFRAALAEQFARRTDNLLNRLNPEQSRVLVFALGAVQAQPAVGALLEALSNGDPATRLLAARGIAAFGGDLGEATDQAVERLGQVALAETVPLVKAELCHALGMPARVETVVPLLAEIIGNYSDRLRQEGLAEVAPLLVAIDTMGGLRLAGVAPKDQPETAQSVANLFHYAVVVYTSEPKLGDNLKEDLERIIYRSEAVLGSLLSGQGASDLPKVAEAMMAGGDDAPDRMRSELNKWLGAAGTAGVLNAAPWSLPEGGGFAEVKLAD